MEKVNEFRQMFRIKAIKTEYWMPGDNYLEKIAKAVKGKVADGDIIVVSEKAIAVAKGLIIDEEEIKPSLFAKFLAHIWMRIVWGYFLGNICHLKRKNIERLRRYPLKEGSSHKEAALRHAGFLNALMWGSEGGIDGSNLPYTYVSLPLKKPKDEAEKIRKYLHIKLGKKVSVMIIDSDKTYSLGGFHFTHRPNSIKEIHNLFGFIAYVTGRFLRLKCRATPIALSGIKIDINLALEIADIADKAMGSGAGYSVWDMAERFGTSITGVTWSMLKKIRHKPIAIIRLHQTAKYKNI